METKILSADNTENIKLCAKLISSGRVVAIPTETVYGLGANALDKKAVREIFSIKGRPQDNPLIVHIATIREVEKLVKEVPAVFNILARTFWPGPLTLIMKKSEIIPGNVTAGLDTVAIRMPRHQAALSLISSCKTPIAAPSANLSGRPSPTKAVHVKSDLNGKIPYILDGGSCCIGLESTVLDISRKTPRILRPGSVTIEDLSAVIKNVEATPDINTLDSEISDTKIPDAEMKKSHEIDSPRSPGMKYLHYAPRAPLTAVLGSPDETAIYIKKQISDKTAALMFDDFSICHPNVVTYGKSDDYASQAINLFSALREFDALDISQIYAQTPYADSLGYAIADRIKKAAGSSIIDLKARIQ